QAFADRFDFTEQGRAEIFNHVVAGSHFGMATAIMAKLPTIGYVNIKGDAFFRPDLAQPAMRSLHPHRHEIRSRRKGCISGDGQSCVTSYRFFMHSASTLSIGRSGEALPVIRAPERHSAG